MYFREQTTFCLKYYTRGLGFQPLRVSDANNNKQGETGSNEYPLLCIRH